MKPSSKTRVNLYDEVTSRIVSELEAGRIPWVQPWASTGGATPLGLPVNAATGRTYSGVNILLLWDAACRQCRSSQRWLTFKQALGLGGAVRKGEKGTMVVFADAFTPKAERERADTDGDDARQVRFLKRWTVFHAEQCEGLPPVEAQPLPGRVKLLEHVEEVILATGAEIRIGGDMAFYAPGPDFIQVPPQEAYYQPVDWYRTKLHELGHWTGHASRLERDFSGRFGNEAYAREELVAELCSAFLCAELNVQPTVRHADYIGAWLEVMKGDSRAIFQAASAASKAAAYILGLTSSSSKSLPDGCDSSSGDGPSPDHNESEIGDF